MAKELTKPERTRQFIIEKTAPVFNAKGFAGTSMNDLIKATGLTKGSIYGNFQNKDEVAVAAFDHNFARVTSYIKSKIAEQENAAERLLIYPKVYRNFLKIPFLQAGCPLLNTAVDADDTHPVLRKKAADALSFWKRSIENQVKRGIERKEISAKTNAAEFAVIIISVIEGAVMQAKVTGRSADLNTGMNFLEDYIRATAL